VLYRALPLPPRLDACVRPLRPTLWYASCSTPLYGESKEKLRLRSQRLQTASLAAFDLLNNWHQLQTQYPDSLWRLKQSFVEKASDGRP